MHEEVAAALAAVMGMVNMAFFSLAGASLVLVRPQPAALPVGHHMASEEFVIKKINTSDMNRTRPSRARMPQGSRLVPASLAQ